MSTNEQMPLAELLAKASAGDANTAQDLAYMYDWPDLFPHPEIAEKNQTEAERWSREARRLYRVAAEAGDKGAMYSLALDLDEGTLFKLQTEEAFHWMERAANAGNATACMALSQVMADKSTPHYNLAEALKWSVKAAWADLSIFDEQVPAILQDIRILAEEVSGYHKDAQDGDPEAQFQMGHIFYLGHGVDSDPAEAREWWLKAAEQGHERAKQMLSETVN